MNQRASGRLLHPTFLPNHHPIADVGSATTLFADFLAKSGQRWWRMLPVCVPGIGIMTDVAMEPREPR